MLLYETSFEAMTVTRDLIVSHLNSSTQGPIVAIVGAANEYVHWMDPSV